MSHQPPSPPPSAQSSPLPPQYDPARHLTIAVEGCAHGDLDRIYEAIEHLERTKNTPPVDLLICCGDFQAIRTEAELNELAAPAKHRHMKDFHRYWKGEKSAPVTTVFVGGNHEAPSHLRELYYGGWAAKGIYYLGHSGVVRCKGVRIGGFSGIYKGYHYDLGHYEVPPYTEDTKRSAYHARKYEMDKLAALLRMCQSIGMLSPVVSPGRQHERNGGRPCTNSCEPRLAHWYH
ncbi:lariat debranching enzyme [Perkinsus olseni]|uniref:Lariat debranching enzyme n=1 Tax=Perkinsus olseni TaxID=32597 RepID=A0A7J6QXI0_PEROL|nr:lariat debranching enzyme [Perkinsus olseni]